MRWKGKDTQIVNQKTGLRTVGSFSQTPYRIGALRSAELSFGLWSSLRWRGPQLGAERTAQYERTLYFTNLVFFTTQQSFDTF